MPVVPATRETEAGELLEHGGGGCSAAWTRVTLHLKNKTKQNTNVILTQVEMQELINLPVGTVFLWKPHR